MMRIVSMLCLVALVILALAWGLPQLYSTALLKQLDKTHVFFSPTLQKFIYTEQIYGHDEEAARKSDGHHADIVYKDEDGVYYDRLSFEAALPFIYFRNMEMRGLLPVLLEGRTLQRADIERSRRVLELPARQLDGRYPSRPCLPLLEANPGQVALVYPTDRFRCTESAMQFINADSNTPDLMLTQLFTTALLKTGLVFPVRHVGGNFTTFKPHEGGIYLVDRQGRLFHLLRRDGQPQVQAVPLASGVVPRHVLVSESRERRWAGLMLDNNDNVWLMREELDGVVPAFLPLDVPQYDPDRMDCKLIFDPLYLTVVVSDSASLHAFVYRLPEDTTAVGAPLAPLRSFTHHMSRDQRVWQHAVADTLFPFRLTFAQEDSAWLAPALSLSPRWLTHALPASLLLSLLYAVRLRRRRELEGSRWIEVGLVLATGIFGLVPLYLLDERG